MGKAYRTWIILYCTKALFACVALHVFSSIKMSKRKQATLGEFEKIISFTLSSRTDVCLLKKNFSLRLFLNCSYFSSDFSLNVLIKFVLILKKKSALN